MNIPFTSGFQAMISAMQITSLSLLTILASRKLIHFQWTKIAKSLVITLLPVLLLFSLIKTFNPLPEIKNDKKSIFELSIASHIHVTTHNTPPIPSPLKKDLLQKILQTQKLRVGYSPSVAPFSFYNVNHQIVGYDIAFAYELAYDLNCDLELIPMNYANIVEELQSGLYDIAMSSVSINEERLKSLSFTPPYLQPSFVFVTKNAKRKKFTSLVEIKANQELSIAVLKGTSYEKIALELFPLHKMILLETPDQFATNTQADALFWTEDEAIAWSLHHRHFRVVHPSPSMGKDSLSYAINQGSPEFTFYLNQWLQLKQNQGYTQKQYNLWILEKTEMAAPPTPRWSLLKYLEQEVFKKNN